MASIELREYLNDPELGSDYRFLQSFGAVEAFQEVTEILKADKYRLAQLSFNPVEESKFRGCISLLYAKNPASSYRHFDGREITYSLVIDRICCSPHQNGSLYDGVIISRRGDNPVTLTAKDQGNIAGFLLEWIANPVSYRRQIVPQSTLKPERGQTFMLPRTPRK